LERGRKSGIREERRDEGRDEERGEGDMKGGER
jgi:hypothetical protein